MKIWYQTNKETTGEVILAISIDNRLYIGIVMERKGWKRRYMRHLISSDRSYVTVLEESDNYIESSDSKLIQKLTEIRKDYEFLL